MKQDTKAPELLLNLGDWIERRKADIGPYADHIIHSVKAYENALDATQKRIDELERALVAEREEVLWNAYNVGHERDGKWHHCCMSDGEWLVRECGVEPIQGHLYDAAALKAAIPNAARTALTGGE